jgi:hypothetical protein
VHGRKGAEGRLEKEPPHTTIRPRVEIVNRILMSPMKAE